MTDLFSHLPLGKNTHFVEHYDPQLIATIDRNAARKRFNIAVQQASLEKRLFWGVDLWNSYEMSWLNEKGVPQVGILTLSIPAESPLLLESKSAKLYLASFNQSKFETSSEVLSCIEKDISSALKVNIQAAFQSLSTRWPEQTFLGTSIDDVEVSIDHYDYQPNFLQVSSSQVEKERLYSHVLRTLCPVTGQPDWASVFIEYSGAEIVKEGLLRYLVSLRCHSIFHEMAIERIFLDIMERCRPKHLSVYGAFTRRGGIDINPFRSTDSVLPSMVRVVRQ
jgi:7-cyano-7-deazaguanine reductase